MNKQHNQEIITTFMVLIIEEWEAIIMEVKGEWWWVQEGKEENCEYEIKDKGANLK